MSMSTLKDFTKLGINSMFRIAFAYDVYFCQDKFAIGHISNCMKLMIEVQLKLLTHSRVIFIFLILVESTFEEPSNRRGKKKLKRRKVKQKTHSNKISKRERLSRLLQNDQPRQPYRQNINERGRRAPFPRK